MSLQLFIAVNVLAASVLMLLAALVYRQPGAGTWIGVNALIAAVTGLGIVSDWPWTGVMAVGLFLPLVIAPGVLAHFAQRRRLAQRNAEAARLSRLLALLHPTREARFGAELLEALAAATPDETIAALSALKAGASDRERRILDTQIAVTRDDWDRALAIAAEAEPSDGLAWLEIRALGELGRPDAMAAAYERHKIHLDGNNLLLCRLFVLALTGRRDAVETVLGRLPLLHPDNVAYWRAVAASRARPSAPGVRQALVDLERNARLPSVALAAARHAAALEGSAHPVELTPAAAAVVASLEARIHDVSQRPKGGLLANPATLLLIALNTAAFAWELSRGAEENARLLAQMGALVPGYVIDRGEWWRLLTATFLHFGWLHVALNMLILSALGPAVEARVGSWRMLASYLAAAVLSSASVVAMMELGIVQHALLVGASGAIFALLGMLAVGDARRWLRTRDSHDLRNLAMMGIVLAVQFAADLIIPEVSLAAHVSGLVVGMLVGLVAEPRRRRAA